MELDKQKSIEGSEDPSNNIEQIACKMSALPKEHMSEDEIKKRLTDRAMTYLMFLDD